MTKDDLRKENETLKAEVVRLSALLESVRAELSAAKADAPARPNYRQPRRDKSAGGQ